MSRVLLPPSVPRAADAPAARRPGASVYQPFAGFPSSVVSESLAQVLASRTFRRSQRHQSFLRHVVQAALDGRHDELKEVVIGLDVFGRAIADYDPRRDPIVRVEAGRVREKLARYYAEEGGTDPFEIQLPVGGYLPQLVRRTPAKPSPRNLGSLAVMPFANLSASSDDARFCEALADQLIDLLSRVPGLRVVGRMSAFQAQAKGLDPKAIGRVLGVRMIVEGSVQRAGSRCRCIAQLVRANDRVCVWSQRFDCAIDEKTDLFAFQDRIGAAILAAVVPPDAVAQADAPVARQRAQSASVEARDLFERGRYLEQKRTIDGWQKAIPLFRRAIAIDPTFASAYSHLGATLGALATINWAPTVPANREVEWHARRALELDPHDGDALAILANIAFRIEFDWPKAEALFREALRVAPNSAMAHNSYGGALVMNGRYVEGVEHARIGLDLDPLNVALRANYALIRSYARDFATADHEFRAVLDFDPDHLFAHIMLGMNDLWSGRDGEALAHFERSVALAPDHPTAYFCLVFVDGFRGAIAEGKARLARLLERFATTPYSTYNHAMAEAYLGDRDAMMAALRRVAAAHEVLFITLPADPTFDRYHDDPDFIALCDAYRLPRPEPSPFLA